MKLLGTNILVKELTDNIVVDGIATRHDYDSNEMFCEVIKMSEEAKEYLYSDGKHTQKSANIVVISRMTKSEFIGSLFFISYKDIRLIMDTEAYKKIIKGEYKW